MLVEVSNIFCLKPVPGAVVGNTFFTLKLKGRLDIVQKALLIILWTERSKLR